VVWCDACVQVIATAKSSDLVLMVLDAGKEDEKNHR
jgi:ribosome-interacting GTPase 1